MQYPVHLLTFANNAGLDLPLFNTIRLGRTWANRVNRGDRVILTHKDQAIGEALVTLVDCGRVRDMLARHALGNHMERALRIEQGASYVESEAPQRRFESMQKLYGPHKLTETSYVSVIGLSLALPF